MSPSIGLPSGVAADDVFKQLDRILDSELFQRSERLRRFLLYSVHEGLNGGAGNIKEYTLGREVFDKPENFDTRNDPVVRVEAGRLRAKIREFYATTGANDGLFVGIRDHGYLPLIRDRAPETRKNGPRGDPDAKPCVAVLPFRDLSLEGNQEPFCAALTHGISHGLIREPGLRVIGSTGSRGLHAESGDVMTAARELAIGYIVEGSVQRQDHQVRISVELSDTETGRSLWAHTLDRKLDDILLLQEEAAEEVAEGLRRILLCGDDLDPCEDGEDGIALSKGYAHFIRGQQAWSSGAVKDLRISIERFEQAGRLDAEFAPAWAALANARIALALSRTAPPGSLMREAKTAAYRAIAVDNGVAEAHAAKGTVEALCDFDWQAAEASFECARALDSKLPLVDQWHALAILLPQGKIGEASRKIGHAQKADPTSILLHYYRGVLQYLQGKYEDAATILEMAVELEPEYESAHLTLGDAYLFLGREQEAMRRYARVKELAVDSASCWRSAEAYAHARAGRTSQAKRLLRRMVTAKGTGYSWPYEVAAVYAALGEEDEAFGWLERAREDGVPTLAWLQYDPKLSGLRKHERFAELLRRLGLGGAIAQAAQDKAPIWNGDGRQRAAGSETIRAARRRRE